MNAVELITLAIRLPRELLLLGLGLTFLHILVHGVVGFFVLLEIPSDVPAITEFER